MRPAFESCLPPHRPNRPAPPQFIVNRPTYLYLYNTLYLASTVIFSMFQGVQRILVDFSKFYAFIFSSKRHSQRGIDVKQFFDSHVYFSNFQYHLIQCSDKKKELKVRNVYPYKMKLLIDSIICALPNPHKAGKLVIKSPSAQIQKTYSEICKLKVF